MTIKHSELKTDLNAQCKKLEESQADHPTKKHSRHILIKERMKYIHHPHNHRESDSIDTNDTQVIKIKQHTNRHCHPNHITLGVTFCRK